MTEKVLPFTDEVIVVLVHKCLQQLQLLALHLDMLGYILGLLNGFGYLSKTGDLIGDNLTYGLLRKIFELDVPRKLTDDTENNFRGLILTVGKRVRKLWVEFGIRTEDAACNLRGDSVIFNLSVIVMIECNGVIPSRKEQHSYRSLNNVVIYL